MNKSIILITILSITSCGNKSIENVKNKIKDSGLSESVQNVANAVKYKITEKVIKAKDMVNEKVEEANAKFDESINKALAKATHEINEQADNIRNRDYDESTTSSK